eukprot:6203807-Pleurochrysis_carterae.AAC.1
MKLSKKKAGLLVAATGGMPVSRKQQALLQMQLRYDHATHEERRARRWLCAAQIRSAYTQIRSRSRCTPAATGGESPAVVAATAAAAAVAAVAAAAAVGSVGRGA